MYIEKAKREFVSEITNMAIKVREVDNIKIKLRLMDTSFSNREKQMALETETGNYTQKLEFNRRIDEMQLI